MTSTTYKDTAHKLKLKVVPTLSFAVIPENDFS